MRDRLIELLKSKYDHYCDQCGVNKDSQYIENLADYLLANGVVVLPCPCKVGDKIYFAHDKQEDSPAWVDEGTINGISLGVELEDCNFFARYESGLSFWHRKGDGLGFFDKEEAERALAERKGKE